MYVRLTRLLTRLNAVQRALDMQRPEWCVRRSREGDVTRQVVEGAMMGSTSTLT